MPIFMIERKFAEPVAPRLNAFEELNAINDDQGVRWLYSFLSPDRLRTFCLYEAESAEAIRRAAERAGIPAGLVIEVSARVYPDGSMTPVA
jgi:hypothetical protein